MTKVRVYELARELNVETKVLLSKLKGAKVLSHQSTLTDQQVAELRTAFGGSKTSSQSPAATAAQPAASQESAGGKPRVVIRRRAASASPDLEPATGHSEVADAEPEVAAAPAVEPTVEPVVAQVAAPAPEAVAPTRTVSAAAVVVRSAGPRAAPIAAKVSPVAAPVAPVVAPVVEPEPIVEAVVEAAPEPAAAEPTAPEARVQETRAPETRAPGASASTNQVPPAAAAAPAAADSMRRRREAAGATIVRRATPEEVKKNEELNQQRHAGRKEDHRGTRVTGLGLLSNRVSSRDGGVANPDAPARPAVGGTAGTAGEEAGWGDRRTAKEKKAFDDEEAAKKKAAAKKTRGGSVGQVSMRALLEQAEVLTSDLTSDEEVPVAKTEYHGRTVYTPTAPRNKRDIKRRKDLKKTQVTTPRAAYRVVEMGEGITVGELAQQMAVKSSEIIKKLMSQGVMATINQNIDVDTATLLANEYGFELKSVIETVEDIIKTPGLALGEQTTRPPIVTVMGHVDHGKTSILDAIRKANVAGGEAGGITQHIGAYSVAHNGKKITFLDTPGHEAFSSMRARGAKVTDIVILVVAADDGVMPQTIEAINHAKAAGVPIIVAVNKIDKPNVNFDRVYTELTEHGIQAEEWGGEVQFIKVSALKKTGIDELLEAIVLQSEVLDLKASTEGQAEGTVIEAHLDKGRGPVATVVVERGTLRTGDHIVAGTYFGRVRAMHDHFGKDKLIAGPAEPVEIIGLGGVPMAGDKVNVVENEKTAREAADWRLEQARKAQSSKSSAQSLEDLLARVKSAEVIAVPIIIKGDTQGSIEAINETIVKLNTPKVRNRIVHSAVGGVTESDITLSAASGALIIAFNVRAGRGLDELAERQGVVIKYFSIIYEIVDAVKAIMVGKLPPIVSELVLGHAEVRKPISVPKIGTIGGSAVLDGKITRSSHCRLIRDSVVIYTGRLGSLRRFKDDVKEVVQGYECGIGIDGYNDLREGDIVEAFVLEETAATL